MQTHHVRATVRPAAAMSEKSFLISASDSCANQYAFVPADIKANRQEQTSTGCVFDKYAEIRYRRCLSCPEVLINPVAGAGVLTGGEGGVVEGVSRKVVAEAQRSC